MSGTVARLYIEANQAHRDFETALKNQFGDNNYHSSDTFNDLTRQANQKRRDAFLKWHQAAMPNRR